MTTGVRWIVVGLVLGLLVSLTLRAQSAPVLQPAPRAPVQPLPYSHKQHLALGLPCKLCHVNPDAGKLMTYPVTATCMTCHTTVATDRPAIQKLATYAAENKPIPWVRVYEVPDYVFWSHGSHLRPGNQRRHHARLPHVPRQAPGVHRLRCLPRTAATQLVKPAGSGEWQEITRSRLGRRSRDQKMILFVLLN
jgi:hypothetical protein